ncbi:uncharacterized protein BKCO1_26000137 [Diplodia corticola]|uniref:Uncharacterized protein n=1 Tax=Diplodia corticola TaxID=236234 RepID=A0A1J9S1L4_9PEZI|nr:uncharacterized protein BKCO1_26000137 [Diplodia corticola]OJD33908.1 hypothetical protein BKCO1_26000137 [Diplodia corticola]
MKDAKHCNRSKTGSPPSSAYQHNNQDLFTMPDTSRPGIATTVVWATILALLGGAGLSVWGSQLGYDYDYRFPVGPSGRLILVFEAVQMAILGYFVAHKVLTWFKRRS